MIPNSTITTLLIVAALLSLVALVWIISRYFLLWLQAYVSGTRISMLSLIAMSMRKVDPRVIVRCRVMIAQSGLPQVPIAALEAQYLAGGNVQDVTLALIAADRSDIVLDWDTAAAVDLAGRNIMEAVLVSVNPKIISCPDSNDPSVNLSAVAKDGIQLQVRVRVTVRTNLKQLVGGAMESTVIARVGQSVVSAIGSCETYQDALCDPMVITRQVLAKGLDSQTAFEIISIDIADIDVGANIGAQLQSDEAEAVIRIARAAAETRRAAAIALQQQMKAAVAGSRASVVLAEVNVPLAMSTAYIAGRVRATRSPRQAMVEKARRELRSKCLLRRSMTRDEWLEGL